MCNKLLCLLILVFVIGGVAVAGTAEPNLVAFYRFDDGSGNIVHDYSGNGYDATTNIFPSWDNTGFYGNCCMYFYGGYGVSVPNTVVSELSDEVTVSVWVNSDDPGTYANALFWGTDSGNNLVFGAELPGNYNSHLWFHAGYSSGSRDTYTWWEIANTVAFRGQWNNFTFTKDASAGEMKIYINGVLLGTSTGKFKTMENIVNFKIGSLYNGTCGLKGRMADFKIFDRALCAAEISEQAGNSLVGWWKFEETSGTVAYDSSSYRHDGTLGGSNSWDGGVIFTGINYGASKVGFASADASEIFDTIDDQITVAFWARNDLANSSGHNRLFTGKNSSGTVLLNVELPTVDGTLIFKAGDNNFIRYEGINDSSNHNYLDMQHWHHYVLIKDVSRSDMKIYIDGYLAEHITKKYYWQGGFWPWEHDLWASMTGIVNFELCGSDSNWHQFAGTVRDFRIYNTAITSLDVRDIYNQYAVEFNNTYYVDADYGNDSYNGKSPATAWKSISKLNCTTFQPLDKILLKAGCAWSGTLNVHGSGRSGEPIVIDAYGDISDEDDKPCINAGGNYGAALNVYNVEYWEINNLQFTNQGATAGAWRKGVSISADNFGTMRHIHLKNLYVHDVNGKFKDEPGAGIAWHCGGATTASRFYDLLIEGCHVKTTDREGILGGNANCRMNGNIWYPSLHVVIRGNFVEDVGGNGILPIGCDGCIVEYNKVDRCGQRMDLEDECCAGIWPWSCDNTVIQYNESSNVKLGVADGQGFDSDWNCNNSLFQYNYSHDNGGGFILVCNDHDAIANGSVGNNGTVIRYNISQNDDGYIISLGAEANIYNNVIYVSTSDTPDFVYNWRKNSDSMHYYSNNIFYTTTTANFRNLDSSYDKFTNNCFYGNHLHRPNYDAHAITTDPKLVNPGSGAGIDSLDGYKLQSSSPCRNTGHPIDNNGGLDFWGNFVYPFWLSVPSIGAHEPE